jgi:Uma2 family endonuclease
MTLAKPKPMTLAEYLDYDDAAETRCELVDGVLVEMGAESYANVVIGSLLFSVFLQFAPYYCVHRGTEIAVLGAVSGSNANTRYPDLVVITEAGAAALTGKRRSLITTDMPAPRLVVEVVSSSDRDPTSKERDYVYKRSEYAQRGIPEYWIVDPIEAVVLVLELVGNTYREHRFTADEQIVSPGFADLKLSAKQVLTAGQ